MDCCACVTCRQSRSSRYVNVKQYVLLSKPVKRDALWHALLAHGIPHSDGGAGSIERTQHSFSGKTHQARPSTLHHHTATELRRGKAPPNAHVSAEVMLRSRILMAEDNSTNILVCVGKHCSDDVMVNASDRQAVPGRCRFHVSGGDGRAQVCGHGHEQPAVRPHPHGLPGTVLLLRWRDGSFDVMMTVLLIDAFRCPSWTASRPHVRYGPLSTAHTASLCQSLP